MMSLTCVVLDKDSDEYSLSFVSSFLFLDCTRAADQNYTGLVTVHLSTVKELQRQYDITTECEVRRLTSSPNQMVTQGAPWGRKGGSAFDLLSYASALSLSLSLSPFLSTDVHVCTGVRKGEANWTSQYLISTGGIFLAKADHVWFMNVQSFASSGCLLPFRSSSSFYDIEHLPVYRLG